jgi:16S rRNA G966 N2-methylase RsmD
MPLILQETVNNRLKNWGVLRQLFRYSIVEHWDIFRAVAVLTQLSINSGEKLFSTGYCDPPYTNTSYDARSDDENDGDEENNNLG